MFWTEEAYTKARNAGHCEKCEYSMVCLTSGYIAKIPAIKYYRRETGASLKDAKRYVEDKMLCQNVAQRTEYERNSR